ALALLGCGALPADRARGLPRRPGRGRRRLLPAAADSAAHPGRLRLASGGAGLPARPGRPGGAGRTHGARLGPRDGGAGDLDRGLLAGRPVLVRRVHRGPVPGPGGGLALGGLAGPRDGCRPAGRRGRAAAPERTDAGLAAAVAAARGPAPAGRPGAGAGGRGLRPLPVGLQRRCAGFRGRAGRPPPAGCRPPAGARAVRGPCAAGRPGLPTAGGRRRGLALAAPRPGGLAPGRTGQRGGAAGRASGQRQPRLLRPLHDGGLPRLLVRAALAGAAVAGDRAARDAGLYRARRHRAAHPMIPETPGGVLAPSRPRLLALDLSRVRLSRALQLAVAYLAVAVPAVAMAFVQPVWQLTGEALHTDVLAQYAHGVYPIEGVTTLRPETVAI